MGQNRHDQGQGHQKITAKVTIKVNYCRLTCNYKKFYCNKETKIKVMRKMVRNFFKKKSDSKFASIRLCIGFTHLIHKGLMALEALQQTKTHLKNQRRVLGDIGDVAEFSGRSLIEASGLD